MTEVVRWVLNVLKIDWLFTGEQIQAAGVVADIAIIVVVLALLIHFVFTPRR